MIEMKALMLNRCVEDIGQTYLQGEIEASVMPIGVLHGYKMRGNVYRVYFAKDALSKIPGRQKGEHVIFADINLN